MNILEFLWNTPEKYWLIVFGYHIHKAFWGVLLMIVGFIATIQNHLYLGIISVIVGLLLIILHIRAHIYTNNKPYFILWDKHPKKLDI